MISNKLKQSSVDTLKTYLNKERTRPLSNKVKKELKELIEIRHSSNVLYAEQIVNSKIFKLGRVEEIRKGRAIRHKLMNGYVYDLNLGTLFPTMINIVNHAHKKNLTSKLK